MQNNPLTRIREYFFGAGRGLGVLRDGVWVAGGQIFSAATSLAADSYLFRLLSVGERGLLSAAQGLAALLLAFTDLGVSLTTIHFGAKRLAAGDEAGAAHFFRRALFLRCAAALAVGLVCLPLSSLLAAFPLSTSRAEVVVLLALALPLQSVICWGADTAQARRRFAAWFVQQSVFAVLRAATLILLVQAEEFQQVEALLWGVLGASAAGAAVILTMQKSVLFFAGSATAAPLVIPKETLTFARWAGIGVVLSVAGAQAEILLLQGLLGDGTAVYDGALRLARALPLFTAALTTVLLPRASALRTTEEIRSYLRRVIKVVPAAAAAAAFGLAVAGHWLIPLLWGEKYDQSLPLLRWLCAAYGLGIVLNPLMLVLYPLKRIAWITALGAFDLGLALTLNFFLIPKLGAFGAVLSVFSVKFVSACIAIFFIRQALRLADKQAQGGVT